MMKKSWILSILTGWFTASFASFNPVNYVDPMIGSDYHGNVFVGASVPFGMVQVGPTNLSKGWHWCSGYHYSDSTIIGFSHTHLNGTGIGDLGDILVMPTTGPADTRKGSFSNLNEGYVSLFSHQEETVKPGYYSVYLKKHRVKAELTSTNRVGYHRYTFPESKQSNLIFDLGEGIEWDEPTATLIKAIDSRTIEGYRYSKGWAKNQKVYFRAVFSKDMDVKIITENVYRDRSKDSLAVYKAVLSTSTRAGEQLELKVALSYVSCENAAMNLNRELPGWNFNTTVKQARALWYAELSKIKIETPDRAIRTMFYTSLFRTMISPSEFCDVNGDYRGADGKVYTSTNFVPHTIFSLWDTYRTLHPLQTILNRERSSHWVNSLLDITEKQGSLPIWHLVGNETGTMVGVHSIPVIVDAVLKNIPGIDVEKAYRLVRGFDARNDRGLRFVREQGWIPADKENWSVSKALEYAVDDYAIALLAKKLGKTADYELFSKRARAYAHYFDPQTGFLRGRLSDGSFRSEYNPSYSQHDVADYVEGNGWQYTFMVPHDAEGLIELFGGKEPFVNKLDSLFEVSSQLNAEASIDISGLIGQYAHGNEPGHSTIYLYSYADRPDKMALRLRQVMNEMYRPIPAGLCGNDDCGQMSAWYVLSALGLYPMNPVNGEFVFGSPLVEKATIRLENGKKIRISAPGATNRTTPVTVSIDGKQQKEKHINYSDLMKGSSIRFTLK